MEFYIGGMPVDPENIPEEMPEQMKAIIRKQYEAYKRLHARSELTRAEIDAFWRSLNLEQMRALYMLLRGVRQLGEEAKIAAAMYEGYARSALSLKFGVCDECGHDHHELEALGIDPHTMESQVKPETEIKDWAEKMNKMLREPDPQTPEHTPASVMEPGDWPHEREVEIDGKIITGVPRSFNDLKRMEEYHLDEEYDADSGDFIRLYCTGCGVTYTSIEDRMLKGPDECSGCFQKAKFG